jgi:peptide/nickel transport system ATP-binding protein
MAGSGTAHLRPGNADIILEVERLVVEYPAGKGRVVHAVSDLSFDVAEGETLGLVGESGCGKSTTAKTIVQLPPPTSGSVRYRGVDLAQLRGDELRRMRPDIQMIFQDPISSLNPRRKVVDIVSEGLRIWGGIPPHENENDPQPGVNGTARNGTARDGTARDGARRDGARRNGARKNGAARNGSDATSDEGRVLQIMRDVGLDPEPARTRRAHQYSGGQCQRISIARALVLDPRILICDEPVSALDVSVQAQILNVLEAMKERYRLTLLFISHDLSVVKNVSDRVAVMYLGKLCEIGDGDRIYETPAHPYTRLLLAAVPDPGNVHATTAQLLEGELPSPIDPPSGCRFRTRCPRAQAVCAEQEPETTQVGTGDHWVACHFPVLD